MTIFVPMWLVYVFFGVLGLSFLGVCYGAVLGIMVVRSFSRPLR